VRAKAVPLSGSHIRGHPDVKKRDRLGPHGLYLFDQQSETAYSPCAHRKGVPKARVVGEAWCLIVPPPASSSPSKAPIEPAADITSRASAMYQSAPDGRCGGVL
jgi:hypothetical protein